MTEYQAMSNGYYKHLESKKLIPNDPANADFQRLQDYVRNGGTILPWKTPEELLVLAIQDKTKEILEYNALKDNEPIPFNGNLFKHTTAVIETINFCSLYGQQDTDPLMINDGNWDNYNGTVSVSMTLGDLKDLYKTGYMICAYNYGVAKQHIINISSLSTAEEVSAYDHTQGWWSLEE